MRLLLSVELLPKNSEELFSWTFTTDLWSQIPMCVRIAAPERRFLSVRQDGEHSICADSFQMHFWFVWFPQRCIENEHITAINPLALLLRLEIERIFSPLLLRKWLLFLFTVLGSIYLYTHLCTVRTEDINCNCNAGGRVRGSQLLVR